MEGGYLAVHACGRQKASQSTLNTYQDGLLSILQLPFLLLHK